MDGRRIGIRERDSQLWGREHFLRGKKYEISWAEARRPWQRAPMEGRGGTRSGRRTRDHIGRRRREKPRRKKTPCGHETHLATTKGFNIGEGASKKKEKKRPTETTQTAIATLREGTSCGRIQKRKVTSKNEKKI